MADTVTRKIYIDWDYAGSSVDFSQGYDDVTAYVQDVKIDIGLQNEDTFTAKVGKASFKLNNETRLFSYYNSSSVLYGKLLPRRPIKIDVITQNKAGETVTETLFYGFTSELGYKSGGYLVQPIPVTAYDLISIIQTSSVKIPVQYNLTTDTAIRMVLNQVFLAAYATLTIEFTKNPPAGDYLTFYNDYTKYFNGDIDTNGLATRADITFVSVLTGAANEVLIGATKEDTAANLVALINGATGNGTTYGALAVRQQLFSASLSSATITLTALIRGKTGVGSANSHIWLLWENRLFGAIPADDYVIFNGSSHANDTFTGSSDLPTTVSFDTGYIRHSIIGDDWTEDTNALSIITKLCETERGYFFIQKDGTPTFKNKTYVQSKTVLKDATTYTSTDLGYFEGTVSDSKIINRVTTNYPPRKTQSLGTIAQADTVIEIPPYSGVDRWQPGNISNAASNKIVKLYAKDQTSQSVVGISSIIVPVAGTDYDAYVGANGVITDNVTNSGYIIISAVVYGTTIELNIRNTSGRSIFIGAGGTKLKVRGYTITKFNPLERTYDDTTSQTAYGVRSKTITIPYAITENYADDITKFTLDRNKNVVFFVGAVSFNGQLFADNENVLLADLFNTITLTDQYTGLSSKRYLIVGITYNLRVGGGVDTVFRLYRLQETPYWILGDATYGKLGNTTILGM